MVMLGFLGLNTPNCKQMKHSFTQKLTIVEHNTCYDTR